MVKKVQDTDSDQSMTSAPQEGKSFDLYIVQYIIGRPANEQSFSSEQALCKLTAPPMIVNMRKIRIKFFIVSLLNVNQIFFSI